MTRDTRPSGSSWPAAALVGLLAISGCAIRGPKLADHLNAGSSAHVELSSTPFFAQQDYQCGPAALATVLQASGTRTRPDELIAEVYLPGRRGSLQAELVAAIRQRDRVAYRLGPTLAELLAELAAARPVLVLQNLGFESLPVWHFAVLIGYDASRNEMILRSGTVERLAMSARKFEGSWQRAGRWAVIALRPDERPAQPDADRYLEAAAGLEAVGRLDAAAIAYNTGGELWPQAALPRLGLGNIAYARGEYALAIEHYRAALQRVPDDPVTRHNLAEALLELGCVDAARAEMEIATRLAAGTSFAATVAESAAGLAAVSRERTRCEADSAAAN